MRSKVYHAVADRTRSTSSGQVEYLFGPTIDKIACPASRLRRTLFDGCGQMLAREHDSAVLRRLFALAAQQHDRIPPAALRGFVTSDRDETPRALAVELLADQDRMTPPPAPCSDRSPPTT